MNDYKEDDYGYRGVFSYRGVLYEDISLKNIGVHWTEDISLMNIGVPWTVLIQQLNFIISIVTLHHRTPV